MTTILTNNVGSFVSPNFREELGNWWLKHRTGRANTPNWDLVVSCQIAGQPGLILVEAKANKNEMHTSGKPIKGNASENSKANHEQIAKAIINARQGFKGSGWPLELSRDCCYQLSNRLAFTWKLATLGIPVVLIYLGFLEDEGISDAGRPFTSHQDWLDYFAECSRDVLIDGFCEEEVLLGGIPVWLLLRSRRAIESSPPGPARTHN